MIHIPRPRQILEASFFPHSVRHDQILHLQDRSWSLDSRAAWQPSVLHNVSFIRVMINLLWTRVGLQT